MIVLNEHGKVSERDSFNNHSTSGKDILGNDLVLGGYVIWQPYTSSEGMHFGKIIHVYNAKDLGSSMNRYLIKTITDGEKQSKTISRRSCELISYLPLVMHTEQYKNEIHLEV